MPRRNELGLEGDAGLIGDDGLDNGDGDSGGESEVLSVRGLVRDWERAVSSTSGVTTVGDAESGLGSVGEDGKVDGGDMMALPSSSEASTSGGGSLSFSMSDLRLHAYQVTWA